MSEDTTSGGSVELSSEVDKDLDKVLPPYRPAKTRYVLYNLEHPELDPIFLPHNACIFVGRDKRTKITDQKCSKKQFSIRANYNTHKVEVKRVGQTDAAVNGQILKRYDSVEVRSPATLELRPGKHKFLIKFDKCYNKRGLQYAFWKEDFRVPELQIFGRAQSPMNVTVGATDPSIPPGWSEHETLLMYRTEEFYDTALVAAFDLDGTLIKTKSGSVFPQDKDDWTFWADEVKTKLTSLSDKGYKIIILTNQKSMSSGRISHEDFKNKIENIASALDIPLLFFISRASDDYRKPAPGVWNYMVDKSYRSNPVFYPGSVMVGDSAGRTDGWEEGRKPDFSYSDRLFAKNFSLEFFTPEEFFLGKDLAPYGLPSIPPLEYKDCDFNHEDMLPSIRENQEVIMIVGPPSSGKTTFCQEKLIPHGYVHIQRDEEQTAELCVFLLDEALEEKKSAVIDSINSSSESRKMYLDVCKRHDVPVRCFLMRTCRERCLHSDLLRHLAAKQKKHVASAFIQRVFDTTVNPTMEEGFKDIHVIPFFPIFPKLEDQELRDLYHEIYN